MGARIVVVNLIFTAFSVMAFYEFDDDFMQDSDHAKYSFEYGVRDSFSQDHKNQWEVRDGDVVKGSYRLLQPDGKMRIVNYYADSKNGFRAEVKYEDNAAGHSSDAEERGSSNYQSPRDDFSWRFTSPVRRALSHEEFFQAENEEDFFGAHSPSFSRESTDLGSGSFVGPAFGLGSNSVAGHETQEPHAYQVKETPE